MAFTLEHVEQIRNGYPRQVGVLPDSVWKHLGWPCPWVYLGQSGLAHIATKHPDISDFDLLWLPLVIASGQIVHVEKNQKQVLVAYKAEPNKFYRSALKAAENGTEVWVDSFYRTDGKQFLRLAKQGPVLRPHQ
ncbi:MAG: hypothetical protein AAGF27_11135 [Pseudomonadota bacterium]